MHVLLGIALLGLSAFNPMSAAAADRYGGVTELKIPAAPTGRWSVAKLTQADGTRRLVFVTPDGHAFWLRGVYGLGTSGSVIAFPGYPAGYSHDQRAIEKVGSRAGWAAYTIKRIRSWAFNTVAEYAHLAAYPIADEVAGNAGTEKIPFTQMQRPAYYPLTAAWGTTKNIYSATDPKIYPDYRDRTVLDVYDPAWAALWDSTKVTPFSDPNLDYFIGITLGDSDDMFGLGPGPDLPAARLHPHIAGAVLIASPTQREDTTLGKTYTDPKVYSKYAFRDLMKTKYGTIAALNAAWGASYTTFDSDGGWPMGKGFLDESGRSPWIGSDRWAFTAATPGVRADLDGFLLEFMRTYFRQVTAYFRARYPGRLMFSMSTFNGWGGITRAPILRAAGEFCDVIHAAAASQEVLDRTMALVGDRPIIAWVGNPANPDSALFRYANSPDFGRQSQADRGVWYTRALTDLLNQKTSGGLYPFAGLKHWEVVDNWSEGLNWGLVSLYDNAYNGKDAVIKRGIDQWGYPSGGEERDYGDYTTPVTRANTAVDVFLATGAPLSTSLAQPTTVPTPPWEAVIMPEPTVIPAGPSTTPPTPKATTRTATTPLSATTSSATSPSTTEVRPTTVRVPTATVTPPQRITTAQPIPVAAPPTTTADVGPTPAARPSSPQRIAPDSPTPAATSPAPTDTRRPELISPVTPSHRVAAATPGATDSRHVEISPRLPGPHTAPQIVFGAPGPRRNRALPVTVTNDTQLAQVNVFVDDKLVLTVATTAPNLKFNQPLPYRKVVIVRVEVMDAGGNRATQQVAIRPLGAVRSAAEHDRSSPANP
jgi:hypothetical protein